LINEVEHTSGEMIRDNSLIFIVKLVSCIQNLVVKTFTQKCPQCQSRLKEVSFDLGYGMEIDSLHCRKCGFNITKDTALRKTLNHMRAQMNKQIKIVRVGNGLGVRIPNEFVKTYKFKKGEGVLLKPELGGIKLVTGT